MKSKQKGNVLIITLIVLMVLTFHILTVFHFEISYARNFQSIKEVDHVRVITNSVIAYIKYKSKNDVLLSDYFEQNNYKIHYTVDDMGDYFYVDVTINESDQQIHFDFDLNKEKNYICRIEY